MNLRAIGTGLYALDAYLMRTNSAISDRSWVARILGPDPRWGFRREFLARERRQTRSTHDGSQTFSPLSESEIYEYRDIAWDGQSGHNYRRGGMSGFFRIEAGEIVEIEKAAVFAHFMTPKG